MPTTRRKPGRPPGRLYASLTVSLPKSLITQLRDQAKATGQSMSEIVTVRLNHLRTGPE